MLLRQLNTKLNPRLAATAARVGAVESTSGFHSSISAQGVGIPERKHQDIYPNIERECWVGQPFAAVIARDMIVGNRATW